MSYLGAKGGSGVYQTIINLMPPHDTYIEAFLGSGVIMKKKAPAALNIGIDLDERVLVESDFTAVNLVHASALQYLAEYDYTGHGRILVYLDPPYVRSTRTSSASYKYEMTDDEHRELLKLLIQLPEGVFVILSGYRNPIYNEMLSDWWSKDFQAMTRGGVRTETVWCNFQPGDIHYHTYAGENSTERQRIKRKAERWASRFAALPAYEKQAVLNAILSTD
ncbi:TPA: DNA adenine methylase [Vibrio parahaemolyticus]|uniref:DNA adenine methylase n=1 Tax=Vibrio parahaemolyticus TaxID=670 RepID=UPI0002A5B183|nr:DNA adenine methylase [Vibrio parahaemolyticus]AGB11015.1 Upf31.0 [Vibrio parahaemolyticus BB22OP]MBE4138097.1 DNA adenine methylase [Vibrio parahaemolyticus]MQF42701.1 DNA adenine methylase [Vibrio parahaemolyticus]TOZ80020.1 DNA adenine methylase [Vibrio parahaemolyticus]TOZ99740.1 DNA adenine methylase [Vibrio parahaemolyticus]